MGNKAASTKTDKKNPRALGISQLPINKEKKQGPSLLDLWTAVLGDLKEISDNTTDNFFNLAHSLFVVLKYLKNEIAMLTESVRKQLLVYLSQIAGTIAHLYETSNQADAESEKNVTLAFQKEVYDEIQSTEAFYYLPEKCETGHTVNVKIGHEKPARITAIKKTISELPIVKGLDSTDEQDLTCLEDIHSSDYLVRLNNTPHAKNTFKDFDKAFPNVYMNDITYKENTISAIQATLGAAKAAVQRTLQNFTDQKNGEKLFCIVRPPSHHAHHDHCEGFCFASTLVLAAKELMDEGKKVLIVDFDVHHGNGTYDQLRNLHDIYKSGYYFIDVYGGSNSYITDLPKGIPEEFRQNMHFYEMNEGYSGKDILRALHHATHEMKIDKGFRPDVILVSAGFDAAAADKFGGNLSSEDYSAIGAQLSATCAHVISFLEGGYNLPVLSESVKHYMLGTVGPVNQPSPIAVEKGLNFLFHSIKSVIPEHVNEIAFKKQSKK